MQGCSDPNMVCSQIVYLGLDAFVNLPYGVKIFIGLAPAAINCRNNQSSFLD